MSFYRESSIVFTWDWNGSPVWNSIIDVQTGSWGAVKFDFERIWNAKKKLQLSASKLRFVHVHPPGVGPYASAQDELMMKAWCQALGIREREKSFHFIIITFNNDDPMNFDYTSRVYRPFLYDDKMILPKSMEIEIAETIRRTLKLLSYGENNEGTETISEDAWTERSAGSIEGEDEPTSEVSESMVAQIQSD